MFAELDVRTLAASNFMLAIVLGIGLLMFARSHVSFRGIRKIGIGYLLFASGFILIGLRFYIHDWLSIIFANGLIFISLVFIGVGIFRFYEIDRKHFNYLCLVLALLLSPCFIYFTFIQANVNARIILISLFIGFLCLYIGLRMSYHKAEASNVYFRTMYVSFLFYAGIFFVRSLSTLMESDISDFMQAGLLHGISLIIFQLMIVITCFTISWNASQKLEAELILQASIDPLTKIYNRRALEDFSQKEISRTKRIKGHLSVVLIDIDFFKKINDTYGHQVGDRVLQLFVERIKMHLRAHDIFSRFGGEEFMLLLPETESIGAADLAEKLRSIIATQTFNIKADSLSLSITASFGVATGKESEFDWGLLVSQSDQALYHAKKTGRNQVVVFNQL